MYGLQRRGPLFISLAHNVGHTNIYFFPLKISEKTTGCLTLLNILMTDHVMLMVGQLGINQ